MPAIQPARLRQQAALLAEHFDNPQAFVRSLHHLMEFYSERARRPGQSGKPDPLVMAYKVRPPVLRLLMRELIPLADKQPAHGLALCDALWGQPYLEFRMLACLLLGQVAPAHAPEVIKRIQDWIRSDLENHLVDALLTHGLQRVRKEEQETLIGLIERWLLDETTFKKQLGLRALLPVIEDPDFENLPAFYKLIQPLARKAPPALRPDLLDILIALTKRSPQESAYFLRQTLQMAGAEDTPWLVRQTLETFPLELQESMRAAVRAQGAAPK